MNAFAIIILATVLGKFFIDTLAQWLNLRSLDLEAPAEFRDLYDPSEYARSQQYTRVNTRFHFIESTFHLVVFLAFWFAGGFNWLDEIVRSRGYGPIVTGIIYIGILGFTGSLLSLPFDIYQTFVIEEKFGFNRTTIRTFIVDRLKGLGLGIAIGAPFLAVILWFFQAAGNLAWFYAWIFATVFLLLIQFIAPIWLMPLFNKFTPLPEGELRQAIERYAASVRFAFKDIFVVDASKRSSKANAFFTGFGRSKRIALFDTLVQQQTAPEVLAVLAHEIGHYQKRHVPIMMAINMVHTLIIFYLLSIFLKSSGLYEAFYMERQSTYSGLLFFGLLYEPISFLLSIVLNVVSRKHELQADHYAVTTLNANESLISGLKKLAVKNLSNLSPHPFYVFLNYSHPPLAERIHRMRTVQVS